MLEWEAKLLLWLEDIVVVNQEGKPMSDKMNNEASIRKADSAKKMMTGAGPAVVLTNPRSIVKVKPVGVNGMPSVMAKSGRMPRVK